MKHSLGGNPSMQISKAWLTNGIALISIIWCAILLSAAFSSKSDHTQSSYRVNNRNTRGFFMHSNFGANWRRKLNERDYDCERSDVIKRIYLGINSYWCDVLLFFTGTLHPYELFSYRDHSPLGQWVLDLPSEDILSWLLPTTMGWSWWVCLPTTSKLMVWQG